MKYVALLSGGKDSCFNLQHCQRNGHQLVAAATLSPHSGKDEIDSYMYQTVGHDAIALIAQALDVPLYRCVIQGRPVEQAAEYGLKSAGGGGIPGDETEDLYALLCNVLEHHPDIQAVSVGAILSNYQRVRVEHVCRRLSLTPLAYLWQRNQTSLLSEMISSCLNPILIKVAGAGLTASDLARPLSSMRPKLTSLHRKFGTHPCGEGGEYETFTIDSPLFKSQINIKEEEIVVLDPSDVAPVAYLRIKEAVLIEKQVDLAPTPNVPVPPLLEFPFEILRSCLEREICDSDARSDSVSFPKSESLSGVLSEFGCSVRTIGPWIAVSGVRLPASHPRPSSIGEEVTQCFDILREMLEQNSSRNVEPLPTSATILLLLPDLDGPTFADANKAYSSFFGSSPPARACVGVGAVGVSLDCLAWVGEAADNKTTSGTPATRNMSGETGPRKALHVQSLSYWAPANIGPYSQAISIPPYTFISGQIGLIPSSLTLPSSPTSSGLGTSSSQLSSTFSTLPLEMGLVLQHTARIIRAAPNSGLGDGSDGGFGGSDQIRETEDGEDHNLDENQGMDHFSVAGTGEGGWIQLATYYLVDVRDVEHVRNNVELIDGPTTPTIYTVLSSLPRGARVEKQVLVHSGRFIAPPSEDEEETMIEKSPQFVQGDVTVQLPELPNAAVQLHYEISGFPPSSEGCAIMFVRCLKTSTSQEAIIARTADEMKSIPEFAPFLKRTLAAKAFVTRRSGEKLVLPLLQAVFGIEMPALTVVPSWFVASRKGGGWDWAVTLMAV